MRQAGTVALCKLQEIDVNLARSTSWIHVLQAGAMLNVQLAEKVSIWACTLQQSFKFTEEGAEGVAF